MRCIVCCIETEHYAIVITRFRAAADNVPLCLLSVCPWAQAPEGGRFVVVCGGLSLNIHACFIAPLLSNRWSSFKHISLFNRSTISGFASAGAILSCRCFVMMHSVTSLQSINGNPSKIITYNRAPNDHMSDLGVILGLSGATNFSDPPSKIIGIVLEVNVFASPKSTNTTSQLSLSITLSGLISRCMTPASCM